MATKTTNYNFTKPAVDDFYDIGVMNANFDLVDSTLKELSNTAETKTKKAVTGTTTLTASKWVALDTAIGEYNYKYDLALDGITATDIFNGSVSLATEEAAQDCGLAQYSETSLKKVTFYAKDKPLSDITINYNYIQGV